MKSMLGINRGTLWNKCHSHLVYGGHQINFLEDTKQQCQLYQAMDMLRKRYGQDAVKRAAALIAIGRSKAIGRVNPFNGEPPIIPAQRRA